MTFLNSWGIPQGPFLPYQSNPTHTENETKWICDILDWKRGLTTVNPVVGSRTCYGIEHARAIALLAEVGIFYP